MINSAKIKEKLSTDDVIRLCCDLQGDDGIVYDAQGHPIFSTRLDHEGGDSLKMYYYPETGLFHCYTSGSTKDIFDVVMTVTGTDFHGAVEYVADYFKLRTRGFKDEAPAELTGDWDIFQKIEDWSKAAVSGAKAPEPVADNMLEYFYPLAAPREWLDDGISAPVMRHYGIRVDSALHKIVIPHRDIDGRLIGIRGRSYDPHELADGKKYMPVFIQGKMYSHPLGKNLFGIYENKDIIRDLKKVCVFEAEKSVMQVATMYGIDKCFAVATCGSSFSQEQMDLLLGLGVEEVILAYDADHIGGRADPGTVEYEAKLRKAVEPLLPYVNVSIIFDYDHILPHKASPSDCGKEKFEALYHQRVRLSSYSQSEMRRKGR